MKFFVLGNINAGKSTFAKKLQNLLPHYPILAIDTYRKTYRIEHKAQQKFISDIGKIHNAIIEMVGFGDVAKAIVRNIKANECVIFYLNDDKQTCLNRIPAKQQEFNRIPYRESPQAVPKTIAMLDKYFSKGELYKRWGKVALKIFAFSSLQTDKMLDTLPLMQYHYISVIRKFFYTSRYTTLIAFGSLGRGTLHKDSDIDLILLTRQPLSIVQQKIHNALMSCIETIYSIDNKIIIIIRDYGFKAQEYLVVEIMVVKKLKECMQYYHGSRISDVAKSIVLGGESLINRLTAELRDFTPQDYSLSMCKNKLYSYLILLRKAYATQDYFGFSFYYNLVITQIMRILCIKENYTQYLYCPKNINNTTTMILQKYNVLSLLYPTYTQDCMQNIEAFCDYLLKNNIDTSIFDK